MLVRSLSAVVFVSILSACGGAVAAVTGGCQSGSVTMYQPAGTDGAKTPLTAAESLGTLAKGPPLRASEDGWEVIEASDSSALLRSGDLEATAIRLTDGTWAVEEARCIDG